MLRLRTFGGLWVENEDGSRRDGVRPRRLALLALLAAAGPKGRSREQILGVLWPESSSDRGRAALSQTLYSLNSDLAAEVVVANTAELRLDTARLTSDIGEFNDALSKGDWLRAAAQYTAPFLEGFYLSEAPEFERWADEQRTVLAHDGARAIERVAALAMETNRIDDAIEARRRLTRLDPLNSKFAAAYMNALATGGDRASAIAHGEAHAELVRRELDVDPDPEIGRLISSLRRRTTQLTEQEIDGGKLRTEPQPDARPAHAVLAQPIAEIPQSQRRRWIRAAIVVVTVALVGTIAWRSVRERSAGADPPVLAVGQMRDLVTPDSAQLGGVLSEMLATSIGRLTQLQVIANSRVLEFLPRDHDTLRSARTDAARRAGATEVLEGELIPIPDSKLRFELRRLDVRHGIVRAGYQIDGTDRIALFDSIAVLIARDLKIAPPTRSLAEASTQSPIAYRLYEEGLRAFTQSDASAAYRLLSAAVKEDSTFAMATYYLWRSEIALAKPHQEVSSDRALALAPHAADRDRLLISTHVLATRWDPAAVPMAESLMARYPNDPEALVRASDAMEPRARAALLNRAIALDSALGAMTSGYCRLCDAFLSLTVRHIWTDSATAAEQTLQRWIRLRPQDSEPWLILADYYVSLGRRDDAEAAREHAYGLGARRPDERLQKIIWDLRSDEISEANNACRDFSARRGDALEQLLFHCAMALRMQGRYHEAQQLVRRVPNDVNASVLMMETGQPLEAAKAFLRRADRAAVEYARFPGLRARNVAWNLTLSATAFAEAGDTTSVRRLIDSVEATGRRSLFERDPLLHHFLRGLLLAKAARPDSAAVEFRAALNSPAQGYTRINYELGKTLLQLNRPAEAIPIVRATLHGGLAGSGLYLTRTETHELLARAFDSMGQRDSAAVHYAIVERAWRNADASIKPRYLMARSRLAALGVAPPHS